jgi:hypothetical protein
MNDNEPSREARKPRGTRQFLTAVSTAAILCLLASVIWFSSLQAESASGSPSPEITANQTAGGTPTPTAVPPEDRPKPNPTPAPGPDLATLEGKALLDALLASQRIPPSRESASRFVRQEATLMLNMIGRVTGEIACTDPCMVDTFERVLAVLIIRCDRFDPSAQRGNPLLDPINDVAVVDAISTACDRLLTTMSSEGAPADSQAWREAARDAYEVLATELRIPR